MQVDAPSLGVYDPSLQSVQFEDLGPAAINPMGHSTQCMSPEPLYRPDLQSMQKTEPAEIVVFPTPQSEQLVARGFFEILLNGHKVQALLLFEAANIPGWHCKQ